VVGRRRTKAEGRKSDQARDKGLRKEGKKRRSWMWDRQALILSSGILKFLGKEREWAGGKEGGKR
jgi:hypothetical protein